MASSLKKRNGTLEFMRFVFCLTIFFFHVGKYLLGGFSLKDGVHLACFPHGAMGVEFFFLLTGVFLAASVDKQVRRMNSAGTKSNVLFDTVKYFWKKYISTFPQHIVAFAVLFIVTVFIYRNVSGWSAWDRFVQSIPSVFLIQMTGWRGAPLNHIEWYLSSMLIAILIVYPLCRLNVKVFTRYIAPVAAIALLVWMGFNFPALTGVTRPMPLFGDWFIYKGNVRALAEILLGTFVYSLGKYGLAPLVEKTGKPVRVILTVVEWLMYGSAVTITFLTLPYGWEFGALAFIFAGVTLSFSGLTYSGRLFDNGVCYFLGKITLPVYLSQLAAIYLVRYALADYSDGMKVWAVVVLTAISSAITMLAGNGTEKLFAGKKTGTSKAA